MSNQIKPETPQKTNVRKYPQRGFFINCYSIIRTQFPKDVPPIITSCWSCIKRFHDIPKQAMYDSKKKQSTNFSVSN